MSLRAVLAVWLTLHGLPACTTRLASLTIVSDAQTEWPVMVLRPNVETRACMHTALFGLVPLSGRQPVMAAAVKAALATMHDGDVLTDVTLDMETVDLLLYRRMCVRARGTVGRRVRVLHVH